MAKADSDVAATVTLARERRLPLAVQSSGHGAVRRCDDGIVLNLTGLASVTVDPDARRVRVSAGTRWREVLLEVEPHGLAPLTRTAAGVGATGYTLGGGVGPLLRRFGFAADSIVSAFVVTADGAPVQADEAEHPELFWALKGGGGNFGVVTALEFELYPVPGL